MDIYTLTHPKRSLTIAHNPYEQESHYIIDPYSRQVTSGRGYIHGKNNFLHPSEEAAILFCGRATGPPLQTHWKPDPEATKCVMTCCYREFGLFERRHHCRRCGDIFCGAHCSHYIRLDQNANFNLVGFASRVCDNCFDDYTRLLYRCKHPPKPSRYSGCSEEEEDDYREYRDRGYQTMSGSSDDECNNTNTKYVTREENLLREDLNSIKPYYRRQL
ncbi:11275_t:CDS:2, partial [Diversispora eburnea]